MPAELPAARVPATHAADARADPHESGLILIERHHERVAQQVSIVGVVLIALDLAARAIEQVQAFRRTDPEMAILIFEQRANVVTAQEAGSRGSLRNVASTRPSRSSRVRPASKLPTHTAPLRSSSTRVICRPTNVFAAPAGGRMASACACPRATDRAPRRCRDHIAGVGLREREDAIAAE